MLERINLILKSKSLNAAQFADEIGVQRSSVSHILTGRNNASLDFILKVLQRYPEIDTDWLVTGKGRMNREASNNANGAKGVNHPDTTINRETKDLFHQPTDSMDNKKEGMMKVSDDIQSISGQRVVSVREEEAQAKVGESVKKIDSSKGVEKIVIFYSDKTFVDYHPES